MNDTDQYDDSGDGVRRELYTLKLPCSCGAGAQVTMPARMTVDFAGAGQSKNNNLKEQKLPRHGHSRETTLRGMERP